MRAGVAISPDTPSDAISEEVGEAADMLLVMTVYPGSYSQISVAPGGPSCRFPSRQTSITHSQANDALRLCRTRWPEIFGPLRAQSI